MTVSNMTGALHRLLVVLMAVVVAVGVASPAQAAPPLGRDPTSLVATGSQSAYGYDAALNSSEWTFVPSDGRTAGCAPLEGSLARSTGVLAAFHPFYVAADTADDLAGATCGGESFSPDTGVVMADGSTKPLDRVKIGDKVEATDTTTGKTAAETVTTLWVNHDTDLMNVTIKAGEKTSLIHATQKHLFWDPVRRAWVQADHLKVGEALRTNDGLTTMVASTAIVSGAADMWDLTVDNDHDFYVVTTTANVLVHNNCGSYENPGHHDPAGGPNPYVPNKAVLPGDAESQFANSVEVNGVRWSKVGSGRDAQYYRYFNDGNDNWHWSGGTNGVTSRGTPVPIPMDQVPISVRRG